VRQIDKIRERFFRRPTKATVAVLFTHGNVIRCLVADALGLPYEAWLRMEISNCGVTEIRVFPSGPALLGYNSVAHLTGTFISMADRGEERLVAVTAEPRR
jgi:broad specificity phosphatase PhoE